ncbi:MAG: YihY/virulence factor BrkB family protein, partial [Desulfobulbaceae bacterium]|nr:YihY/virulence factor BrkB family protein [Desulfobulbaceae bacterium]
AQWAYIKFQIGAANYGAIYGSFAALPLFLLWLQMSWLIVLLGAEISFACQNVDTYEFEPDCLKVSTRFKQILALRIVQLCVHQLAEGKKPWRAAAISHELEIPVRLVREVLFELVQAGILLETRSLDDELAYWPARMVENLRVSDVLFTLEKFGHDTIRVSEEAGLQKFKKSLAKLEKLVENDPANLLIKDV